MKTLFEILKWIFLVMTIFIGLFFLRGKFIFGEDLFFVIRDVITPGYLLLVGIMFSYIFALMNEHKIDIDKLNNFFAKYLIMWIFLWLALAVFFIMFA